MEYYSAIKINEIELFVVRWMDVGSAIQNEVSQKEKKQIPYANTHIWNLRKTKTVLMNLGQDRKKDTDVENGLEDMGRGKGKLGRSE